MSPIDKVQNALKDTFTKWILGLSATVIVAMGGWLGKTINELNAEIIRLRSDINTYKTKMVEYNYELEQAHVKLQILNDRVTRNEMRLGWDEIPRSSTAINPNGPTWDRRRE